MASNNSGKIGLATATITGMNAMIGAGIFTAPAILARNVGPAGILSYLFVICSVWFMAQSIARVAHLFPREGSFYAYAKPWGGHIVGVMSAAFYIIGLTIAVSLLTHTAGRLLQTFFPQASSTILGLICLSILIVVNMFGAALSQLGQRILICCTIFPVLATITMCLFNADFSLLKPFAPHGLGNVMRSTRLVIFGFFGFESAASLFNLVRNPGKNVPRALTYSILLVGALYILFVGSIILAVPLNLFASPEIPLSETLKLVFPSAPWLISIIHISILSAVLGTIHSIIWGSSNLLVSLVKKMKNSISRAAINKQIINPKTSVLLIGICVFISFATIKNLVLFFDLAAIFIVFAYVSSMITLLTLKKEWRSGQNIKTILGIGTALAMIAFALQSVWQQL